MFELIYLMTLNYLADYTDLSKGFWPKHNNHK